jgi:hypothetical protein
MGCGCVRNESFDNIIRNFYDGLIIKNKDINDVFELIKIKKSNTSKINKKKWEIFQDNLLVNPKLLEQSKKFFNFCLEESRNNYDKNEGYFFVSILFFCQSNFEDFIKNFILCCHSQAGLKSDLYYDENEKKNLMKNNKLKLILLFYLNLITNYCLNFVKDLDDNPDLFYEEFSKIFSKEVVEKFFDENIFEKISEVENIDIENFFKEKLNLLKNDNLIRSTIYNDYILKRQKK